jgi:hypothetical protein
VAFLTLAQHHFPSFPCGLPYKAQKPPQNYLVHFFLSHPTHPLGLDLLAGIRMAGAVVFPTVPPMTAPTHALPAASGPPKHRDLSQRWEERLLAGLSPLEPPPWSKVNPATPGWKEKRSFSACLELGGTARMGLLNPPGLQLPPL